MSKTVYDEGYEVVETPIDGKDNTVINALTTSYTFGVDYQFNPKHSLSFESNIDAFPLSTSKNRFEYNRGIF